MDESEEFMTISMKTLIIPLIAVQKIIFQKLVSEKSQSMIERIYDILILDEMYLRHEVISDYLM